MNKSVRRLCCLMEEKRLFHANVVFSVAKPTTITNDFNTITQIKQNQHTERKKLLIIRNYNFVYCIETSVSLENVEIEYGI